MANRDRVYFSHSRKIIGTEEEHQCLLFLYTVFGIHSVTEPIAALGDDIKGTGIYENYIRDNVRLLICREYKGYVGRGQYNDILTALQNGATVLILKGEANKTLPAKSRWELHTLTDMRIYHAHDWMEKFAEVIH